MTVFTVLTGIDLNDMGNKSHDAQHKNCADDCQKPKQETKKEEVPTPKEEKVLSEEEKELQKKKDSAEKIKEEGNRFFKAKLYEEALNKYNEAWSVYEDLNIKLNLCNVYCALEQYDVAIKEAEYILDNTFDCVKRAKAYAKKGAALELQGETDAAVKAYEDSLLENTDYRVKELLKNCQKEKAKREREEYINPEIGEQHSLKGKQLYKDGKFSESIKEFDEAIRRDPTNKTHFSNRAMNFIKLTDFGSALKDCESALAIDPNYVKVLARKASCHKFMKEYHKAMECYDRGLALEPQDQELIQGKASLYSLINSGSDEERLRHAAADVDIQKLMMDPRVQQLLKELQENPRAAQMAIQKDQFLANAVNKLIAAGVIQTR